MNEWEWRLLEDQKGVESVELAGAEVHAGARVRLRPKAGGDVFDLALAGQIATIEAIEQDYEGKLHLCVVVDDDPGRDMGLLRQPGHRFFFTAEEIEPLTPEESARYANVSKANLLIAGIGNIFHGDDGFGVEVAKRLATREFPAGVRVADFGIRGYDLAFALQDGYDTTILVDACPRGEAAGTLYLIEPDREQLDSPEAEAGAIDAHAMNPMNVLRMARTMNGPAIKRVLLLGCEPESLGGEEGRMGLSPRVAAAVDEAVKMIEALVKKLIEKSGSELGPST